MVFLRVALGAVAVAVGLIAALVLRCAQLLRPRPPQGRSTAPAPGDEVTGHAPVAAAGSSG